MVKLVCSTWTNKFFYCTIAVKNSSAICTQPRPIGRCDMTTEAAVTKLYCLFSCGYPKETIKKLMTTNLCGEISV